MLSQADKAKAHLKFQSGRHHGQLQQITAIQCRQSGTACIHGLLQVGMLEVG